MSKRAILAKTLTYSRMNWLLNRLGVWNGLLVLTYHRIGDPQQPKLDGDLFSTSEEDFRQQVAFLKKNYNIIGPEQLEEVLTLQSGQHIMITFDDGYRDNYTSAFSVLQELEVPGVFFLSTGFLDEPTIPWWDDIAWMVKNAKAKKLPGSDYWTGGSPLRGPDRLETKRRMLAIYKKLRIEDQVPFLNQLAEKTEAGRCPQELATELWMTWEMVREMQQNGMRFGGHTVSHPVLANLPMELQDWEIHTCKSRIEAELQTEIDIFSYPVGGPDRFDETTKAALKANCYRWAFSFYGGYQGREALDPYDLPRVAVEKEIDFPEFQSTTTLPKIFS